MKAGKLHKRESTKAEYCMQGRVKKEMYQKSILIEIEHDNKEKLLV